MTSPSKTTKTPPSPPPATRKETKPKPANALTTGSANSSSADPDARHRPLDAPLGQVTRHT